jgi:hypothetical protein
MKAKTFELEKGKYAVVATYSNHNDTTGEDDENTIRTYERPRGKLYDDMATLALRAREYWGLVDLKLRVTKIGFAENKDGHIVRLHLESIDELEPLKIGPLKMKREPELMPGTNDRMPESKKNDFLDAVDLVENKITEYLNGDREQPKLPEKTEAIEAPKQGRLFKAFRGRKATAGV